jgi:outer membrane protein OmpA-like peptidoglycan-associated protein
VASIPLALSAQDTAKPAAKAPADDSASKWDIFAGYSFLAPKGTVGGFSYNSVNYGAIGSITGYFTRNIGVQVEGDYHNDSNEDTPNDDFSGASGGLVFRFPTPHITPFLHVLAGAESVGSYYQDNTWGPVVTAGGGLDFNTPLFNHHLAIRLIQADYQFTRENFPDSEGGTGNFNIARLSAGLVFHGGSFVPPAAVTLGCLASPATIFPGDPVTVTATAGELNPKLNTIYSFSGDGVTVNGATATVATASLAPGSYTVKCGVKEGKPGKEGLKPWESADTTATYTVKAFEPPTIGCSASPSTIKPGETSMIAASGVSPQNRPLTYTYSAASGTISGSGATAAFNSAGAPTGTVAVTCTVTDDKGQAANANASVMIEAPYVAPVEPAEVKQLETRLALHSVFFPTAQPRAEHPNGGLVASQEGTLTTLASDFKKYLGYKPEAHLTLSGHADVRGSVEYNQALSERRVARTKQYLVEQGVPEGSIETRGLGKEENLTADQVKDMVEQNPDLSATEREKVLHNLGVIVWAQNRRVDVTLSTTGQESVRQFPFNAADSLTLLDKKSLAKKKAAAKK